MKVPIRSLTLAICALLLGAATAQAQVTTRVSVATGGVQANGESPYAGAKLSANGQVVAFRSVATNLVAGDTNGYSDIFVHDRATGITTRVSVATGGAQALGGNSNNPSISADGRYVSFSSNATNLVPGDTNNASDVFVHDRAWGTTTLVSADPSGAPGDGVSDSSAISGDGKTIAFRSLATNLVDSPTAGSQIFVRNVDSTGLGTTTLVSVDSTGLGYGNGESGLTQVMLSADGNVVGFSSVASNLVATDTNGAVRDVFVRNLALGTTTLVSRSTSGLQGMNSSYGSALSAEGRYVAFASRNNFVNGDSNNIEDVFVRDTFTNATIRVSVDSAGKQGNAASGYSEGWGISISADGMRVAFQSLASNLVKGDTNGFEDVFLRDIVTGKTTMVSVTLAGKAGNGSSGGLSTCGVSLSADGQTVLFASYAKNLVTGDTNNVMDVFVRGLIP